MNPRKPALSLCACALFAMNISAVDDSDVAALVEGNNDFALALYQRARSERKGNIFLSPYSISTALGMTYAGARGDTAAEMAETLRFALSRKKLHPAFAALRERLAAIGEKGNVELRTANSIWPQKGYRFLDSYVELLKTNYAVDVTPLDYSKNPDGPPRAAINAWVEKRTGNKIKELIKPGLLTKLTRLVLANAIYFKGDWAAAFDEGDTRNAPFKVSPKKSVEVPLMFKKDTFKFADLKTLRIIELPYKGKSLSMTVLLPKRDDGLPELEKRLTSATLNEWLKRLRARKVMLWLPKFKTTSSFDLSSTLEAMGMRKAFNNSADFSGMDGRKDLFVSAVVHKAFVEVNEEGTEAAAATAVLVGLKCAMPAPPMFRADHPFIFLIRENSTGAILFIGGIVNPKK